MRSAKTFLFASIAVTAFATGCNKKETVNSDEVTTKGMSLHLTAASNGSNSSVTVSLHVGTFESGTFARLAPGDQLKLTLADGSVAPLSEYQEGSSGSVKGPTYYRNLNIAQTEGILRVDFLREKYETADNNTLQLPPGFTVSGPTSPVSRRSPVTLQWTNKSSQDMAITAKGKCIFDTTKIIIGDPGSYTFNAGDLKSLSGEEKTACDVTFEVTRTIKTSNGFNSKFGYQCQAEGVQSRSITLSTTE